MLESSASTLGEPTIHFIQDNVLQPKSQDAEKVSCAQVQIHKGKQVVQGPMHNAVPRYMLHYCLQALQLQGLQDQPHTWVL
jgi:hypothetical protein